jgi:hypothetical protein
MGASNSKSIRSLVERTAPAMALMEVLVASAILIAAMLAFLLIIRDARSDLASARANAQATAVALDVLHEARTTWNKGPYTGERNGISWRLSCAASPDGQSARLVVVGCLVAVAQTGRAPMILQSSWLVSRQTVVRPQ